MNTPIFQYTIHVYTITKRILADIANLDHCLYISHRINTQNRAPRILTYKNLSWWTHAVRKGLPSIPKLFMTRYWVITPSATTRAKSIPRRQGNSRVRTILFEFISLPINKCGYIKRKADLSQVGFTTCWLLPKWPFTGRRSSHPDLSIILLYRIYILYISLLWSLYNFKINYPNGNSPILSRYKLNDNNPLINLHNTA